MRSCLSRCGAWFLAGLVLLPAGRAAAAPGGETGPTVKSVRVEWDARLKAEDFAREITQKAGEPLSKEKVRESLKKLYATGRFQSLRADVEECAGGVNLVFVGRAVYFGGVIQIEGAPGSIDSRLLVNAARLHLGEPLDEDELAEASKRIAAVLGENGYGQARVRYTVILDPETQEIRLTFSIEPGVPARLGEVRFVGHPAADPVRLAHVAGWRTGMHMTSARIDRGLFKLHKFYTGQGRLQATVTVQDRRFDSSRHTETLFVEVKAGPRMPVSVEGAPISQARLRELLPVYKDGLVDEPSLRRGGEILEDHFQRQGYFSAKVKGQRAQPAGSDDLHVIYQVTLGPHGQFEGYVFEGNRALTKADLQAALVRDPSAPADPNTAFSRELLARHAAALADLYQFQGFLEARITPHLEDSYPGRPGHLFVTFAIEEGPRTTVRHLVFAGLDEPTQRKLWSSLLIKPGEPYSPARVQADRALIASDFGDLGYAQTDVTWRASPVPSTHQVDVGVHVDRGPQERIRRIILLGNERTRAGVIRRQLTLREGQPLRQSDFLESQRLLYNLGVFNQVQMATQDPSASETEKTVLVNVEEARRWTLGYGGGVEVQRLGSNEPQGQFKASPRLSLDLTRLNVGGRGQTFALSGRLSNLDRGGAVSYLITLLPTTRDLQLRFSALDDRSRDVLTFTARRREASVSVEKRYSPSTLLVGRFSFRRVEVSDIQIASQLIPLFSRPARVAMLGGTYLNDHRDNPADAREGSYSLVDAGVSWDKFGSEANFARLSGQNATYYRLGPRLSFARNTRFQVESVFGSQPREIPLPERFFMGGSESHRGFSINQAGPRDPTTGFPIGGHALFLNSLELRARTESNRFGFVVFHDVGNVFSTLGRMRLLKSTQSSPTDFDYDVHAVGAGLRYKTPVGPLRFDVGYSLNPPRFQVLGGAVPEVRQLSRFQFFLSIGQSF